MPSTEKTTASRYENQSDFPPPQLGEKTKETAEQGKEEWVLKKNFCSSCSPPPASETPSSTRIAVTAPWDLFNHENADCSRCGKTFIRLERPLSKSSPFRTIGQDGRLEDTIHPECARRPLRLQNSEMKPTSEPGFTEQARTKAVEQPPRDDEQ